MIMLDDKTTKDETYPTDAFPKIFYDLIIEFNKSLNYPIPYSGTAILTAVSTVIGTSVKMKVKNKWYEYPSLYCCFVGNAGTNKTHPINTFFEPLKNIDAINHEVYTQQRKEFNEYEKLSKQDKKKVPKIDEPILKKHILNNFSTEALFKRLSENKRGCAIISDEMVTFFETMNNYSKGDQIGNYLSIWNNQSTTVDRIGEPVPMFIKNPFLSIIGGLQPRILSSAFPPQKMNNGFFQRFLFAYPENTQKQPFNDNDINESLMNEYNNFFISFIEKNNVVEHEGFLNSKVLYWSEEAKQFFINWNLENCNLVNEYSGSIKSEILTKFDNHLLRIALILQIMDNSQSSILELKAVENAKKLCDYYIGCSFKVLETIQSPNTYLESLPENKKKLLNDLNDNFTTKDAIIIGEKYDIAERRTKEFLTDSMLFTKLKHGYYEKKK